LTEQEERIGMNFVIITLFLALLACVGCEQKGVADAQFRQYFQLQDFETITPESVHIALFKKFPVRTSVKEISTVIEKNGLALEKKNEYSSSQGLIHCRIFRGSKDLVTSFYRINFRFDVDDKLQEINVDTYVDAP
jgi:hypothetical protein